MEKYVRIGFVLTGLLTWIVMSAAFSALLQLVNPNWDFLLLGAQFTASDLLGLLSGVTVAVVLWFNEKVNRLGMEVGNELRNVTWPTWPETRVSTIVVLVTTLVVSLILGMFDALWGAITSAIYKL
ncbi:MAG: preprotein translocase subunit SecE [Deltaproteobacteria bacterium]|nr:preprotein translocase subunit SecE [Deltaproteobacteria bacterium]